MIAFRKALRFNVIVIFKGGEWIGRCEMRFDPAHRKREARAAVKTTAPTVVDDIKTSLLSMSELALQAQPDVLTLEADALPMGDS